MSLSTMFSSPMIWGILLLTLLPIVGTLMWIVKKVLKLSFSVGKVLLVLFALWFLFTAVTGGFSDVFGNIGKARITHKENGVSYLSAFSSTLFDLSTQMEGEVEKAEVSSALGVVAVTGYEGMTIRLKVRGFGSQVVLEGNTHILYFGEEEFVVGTGPRTIDMTVNAGFLKVEFRP